MEIDPFSIYAISIPDESETPQNSDDLPGLTAIQTWKNRFGFDSLLESYNYYFATTLKEKKKDMYTYLNYHFHRPDCEKDVFLYNLKYHLLELPGNGKFYTHAQDRFFEPGEVVDRILAWIEAHETLFGEYGVYTFDQAMEGELKPTIEQKITLIRYLQQVGQFPSLANTMDELRLMRFLCNQNPASLYQAIRLLEEKKVLTNLSVVREILLEASLADALEFIDADIEQIEREAYMKY